MTKELILENYGVMEMEEKEKMELEGGEHFCYLLYGKFSNY
jgi:hypothetical protein